MNNLKLFSIALSGDIIGIGIVFTILGTIFSEANFIVLALALLIPAIPIFIATITKEKHISKIIAVAFVLIITVFGILLPSIDAQFSIHSTIRGTQLFELIYDSIELLPKIIFFELVPLIYLVLIIWKNKKKKKTQN